MSTNVHLPVQDERLVVDTTKDRPWDIHATPAQGWTADADHPDISICDCHRRPLGGQPLPAYACAAAGAHGWRGLRAHPREESRLATAQVGCLPMISFNGCLQT